MSITSYTLPGGTPVTPETTQGGVSGSLQEIVDLCGESLTLLIAQYHESPRLQNLICAFINRVQELETAALAVYNNVLSIETAVGVQLDLLGRIVGEPRAGKVDDLYRNAIRVRVLINISDGKLEQLIEIIRLFEEMDDVPGSYVSIQDVQPARMEVRVVTNPVNSPEEVDRRVRQAKAAGVALTTMVSTSVNAFTFTTVASYPEKNTTNGFEGIAGPVAGGELLHAYTP